MDLQRPSSEAPDTAFTRAEAELVAALGKPWSEIDGDDDQEAAIGKSRLTVLASAHRFDDALAWSRALKRSGVDWDAQSNASRGAVLSGTERPAAAARLFGPSVEALPWDIGIGIDCFYALGDAGRYQEAAEHIAAHTNRQAFWTGNSLPGEYLANQAHLEGDIAAALGESWAGDPVGGLEKLRTFAEIAPSSADIRLGIAEIECSRGRPRAALAEVNRALGLEPQSISARTKRLEYRIETGDWQGIDHEIESLRDTEPYDYEVLSAWANWKWETAPQIEFEVTHNRSDAVESPGKETQLSGKVRSDGFGPDRRYSLAVAENSEWATFPEGDAEEHRVGAQLRAVNGNQVWLVAGGAVERGGFHGSIDWEWRPSDAFEWTARGESDSLEAPLRARRAGVTADLISLEGNWSWFERGGLYWSTSRLSFSDSNVRQEVEASADWRIWHGAGWELFAGAGFHASRGRDLPDAVYFNPESDFSPETALKVRHRLRGNATLEAAVFGGIYSQEGFAGLGYGGARYQLDWELRRRARLFVAGEWLTHPYDGERENSAEGQLGVSWRF